VKAKLRPLGLTDVMSKLRQNALSQGSYIESI
jgi:hypothetical protein